MAIPGKESNNGVYEFPYMVKHQNRTKWESFKLFIWDPTTKQLFGRTGKNWGQLLLFYTIFYICLAALFAICMAGLYATIDKNKPSYTSERSIIGTNPGLGFRPIADETSEGALIYYNLQKENTTRKWINLMQNFFKDYNKTHLGAETKFAPACSFSQLPKDGQACPVNMYNFGPCSPPNFGYNTSTPCVFLKLNRIYNWIPDYYLASTDMKDMDNSPKDLKTRIDRAALKQENHQVWVSCRGENPRDVELMPEENFRYYPTDGGFPGYYYPFKHNKNDYLSPLVAVQLVNIAYGEIINIECRAWAKNIHYNGGISEKRTGSVHFEIMIDKE